LQTGRLAEAQSSVEHAQAHLDDAAWAARFRVEEAKIRLYRGQSPEAIQLLTDRWTNKIVDRDLIIDRLLILALANSRTGNELKAKTSVAEAEAVCEEAPQNLNKQGEVWSTEGTIDFENGRLQTARKLFQQSLENASTTGNHFLEARSLLGLSAVSLEEYHYQDALAHLHAAGDIANKIGAQQILISAQGNTGWAYYATGDYARALASFNAAAISAAELGAPLDETLWLDTAGMSEAKLGNLDAAREHYRRHRPGQSGNPRRGLGLENKDGTATRPPHISLKALARQSHAVILVYAMSQKASYLWAGNGKESGFYALPDRASILTTVANHRRALLSARDLMAEQHPSARDLYEMLVKPAENLIHPGDRVFIVAGDINGLNFETLLTSGQSSHYWIEDVAITHLASVRLLASAHRQFPVRGSATHQGQLLVIGNPVYSGQQYTALPNAAAEVADVAAHFPNHARTVLTGLSASPDAYIRSDPSRFEYIHFVSHATASRLVPLDSAVILSARGTPDSAKLYARDILSKPLHAELVTISACQGSGVRVYAGEGLVGLAWAFLRAGSRNVIGALWDVSDASTPELMGHLYDGIAAGKSPDVSLRAAKLDMLHSHGIFRKPIYWGAFQLYSSGQ
jgi:CHAT domain-containing protein